MSEYVQITPDGDVQSTKEPFRFQIGDKKFELPALDSANVPLPLIPVFLLMSGAGGADELSDEQRMQVAGTFIAYLENDHPKVWATLKRQDNAILWVNGLIRQWGDHSGLGPKQPASGV